MKKFLSLIRIFLVAFTTCICFGCNAKKKVKINFMVDNSIYSTVTYNGKDAIVMPDNPTKEDYIFEGWYWDKDTWKTPFTENSLTNMSLSPNMEVYAHFIDESYLKGTEINVKNSEKVNIDGIGDVFYLTVRNNQIVCKLYDYIEINPHSSWTVSTDITGKNIIPSKTVELNIGNSPVYYIFVTDKNGQIETYFLMVHRNYMFSISFNSNGGSACSTVSVEEGFYLENVPIPTRVGYTFTNWDYDFNQKITHNISTNAIWNANQYTITYISNDGSVEDNSQLVIYGQSYSLFTPQKLGYTFLGWQKDDGSYLSMNGVWSIASDLQLIADWQIIHYSITYELDGGTFEGNARDSYTVVDSFTIPNPQKKGYTFVGWSLYSNLTNTTSDLVFNEGTTGNKVFYAKWSQNSYTITFNVNNGNALSDNNQIVIFDEEYTFVTPTRTHYDFAGWYRGNDLISTSGIWQIASDVELVARWTPVEYQITYFLNGGTNNSQNPSHYNVEQSFTICEPIKTGYTFIGWSTSSDLSNTSLNINIEEGSSGDKTFYAKWSNNTYVVTYDVNNGDALSSNTQIVTFDVDYNLVVPTRAGYTFNGWYDGNNLVSLEGKWTKTNDIFLIADWTINSYTISYILNNGTNNASNPSFYTVEDSIILENATRTGYTFAGWFYNDNQIFEIPIGSIGDITIEARWNANLYNLSVLSNDESKGTVEITSGQGYANELITVQASAKDNCVFKGWFIDGIKVSSDVVYTFTMPSFDYEVYGVFYTQEEETAWKKSKGIIPVIDDSNNTITYGLYPQKHVTDNELIEKLENIKTYDLNGYCCINNNYYTAITADWTIRNNPRSFDDGESVIGNCKYWFSCEPIKWKILKNVENEYLLLADVLLDTYYFNVTGGDGYSGSNFRNTFIKRFYNTAFAFDNKHIRRTVVDNSLATTSGNQYIDSDGVDTFDNVFLLSYKDYTNSKYGFTNNTNRTCTATDFARAKGIKISTESNNLNKGQYWTRSIQMFYGPYIVETSGALNSHDPRYTNVGIRPAIRLILF